MAKYKPRFSYTPKHQNSCTHCRYICTGSHASGNRYLDYYICYQHSGPGYIEEPELIKNAGHRGSFISLDPKIEGYWRGVNRHEPEIPHVISLACRLSILDKCLGDSILAAISGHG